MNAVIFLLILVLISPRETLVLKALSEGIDIIVKDLRFKGNLKPGEEIQIAADFLVQGQKEVEAEVALVVNGIVEDRKRISLSTQSSISFSCQSSPEST